MTSPVDIVNLALDAIGAQSTVSSINPSDGSAEADVASRQYQIRIDGLLRAAHWGFARRTLALSQLKTAVGALATAPANTLPPPPFLYEYAWPSDCLLARFILPSTNQSLVTPPLTTAPSTVLPNTYFGSYPRFTVGSDFDADGNEIKVILTNAFQAVLVYTARVADPDNWDASFLEAAVATLAAFFVNPLARNAALMNANVQVAQGIIAQARSMNANETLPSIDHMPDWIQARGKTDFVEDSAPGFSASWMSMAFPGGIAY